MPAKPNFTDVDRAGDAIVLTGRSDPEPAGDIVDIRVVLSQGAQVSPPAIVQQLGAGWNADVPAAGFDPGPATAFGIETRRENATTITWAQAVEIPK